MRTCLTHYRSSFLYLAQSHMSSLPASPQVGLFHGPPAGFLELDSVPLLHPVLVGGDCVSDFQEILAF